MRTKLQNILTVTLLCLANLTVFGQSSTKAEFTVDVKPTGNGWEVTSQKFEVVVIPAYERSGAKYTPKGSTVNVIPVSENKQNLVKQIWYNGQTINVPPDYKNTINANASFFSGSIRSMTITVSINGSYYTKELEIYGNRKFDISINVPAGEKPNFSIGGFQILDVKFDDKKVKAVVDGINVFNSAKDEKTKKELDDKIAEGKRERETSAGSTQNTNNSYRHNNVSATQQKIATIDKARSEFNNTIDQAFESSRQKTREAQQKSRDYWEGMDDRVSAITEEYAEKYRKEEEEFNAKEDMLRKINNYDGKYFFSDGLARVRLYEKWGFIDKTGKEVVPPKYNASSNFSEGLAAVKLNGKYGFIDKSGQEVIPFKYDDAYSYSFSEGLCNVKLNGKYVFIDKSGNEVVPFKYDDAYPFTEGLALVKLNDKYGFIDKVGQEVIPFKYDFAHSFTEGLASVKLNGKYGFIDKSGLEVIPFKYDDIYAFSEGLASVKLNGKWGFIDKSGQEIIPFKYDIGGTFSEGLSYVRLNGKYGFIDKTGQEVIAFKYDGASSFSEGLAMVKLTVYDGYNKDKYGFIDKSGNEVIPIKYERAMDFSEGLAPVILGDREFYIDKDGNEVGQ